MLAPWFTEPARWQPSLAALSRPPAHDAAYGQAVNCFQPRVVDNVSGPCRGSASGRTSLHQGPTPPRPERADTAMRSTVIAVAIRLAISASLGVSGVIHAYLYINGYRDIPAIGPGFLGQAIVFCVLALLILAGGPDWLRWVAGVLSVGALVAFALSRTVGLFGFAERGWNPSPQAAVSVIAEVLTVVFVAASMLSSRTKTPLT